MAYDIKNIITKNWDILVNDISLYPIFQEPCTYAFKRAPHLEEWHSIKTVGHVTLWQFEKVLNNNKAISFPSLSEVGISSFL